MGKVLVIRRGPMVYAVIVKGEKGTKAYLDDRIGPTIYPCLAGAYKIRMSLTKVKVPGLTHLLTEAVETVETNYTLEELAAIVSACVAFVLGRGVETRVEEVEEELELVVPEEVVSEKPPEVGPEEYVEAEIPKKKEKTGKKQEEIAREERSKEEESGSEKGSAGESEEEPVSIEF